VSRCQTLYELCLGTKREVAPPIGSMWLRCEIRSYLRAEVNEYIRWFPDVDSSGLSGFHEHPRTSVAVGVGSSQPITLKSTYVWIWRENA
jgi:hypothetical protein